MQAYSPHCLMRVSFLLCLVASLCVLACDSAETEAPLRPRVAFAQVVGESLNMVVQDLDGENRRDLSFDGVTAGVPRQLESDTLVIDTPSGSNVYAVSDLATDREGRQVAASVSVIGLLIGDSIQRRSQEIVVIDTQTGKGKTVSPEIIGVDGMLAGLASLGSHAPLTPVFAQYPEFSPDGKRLVYTFSGYVLDDISACVVTLSSLATQCIPVLKGRGRSSPVPFYWNSKGDTLLYLRGEYALTPSRVVLATGEVIDPPYEGGVDRVSDFDPQSGELLATRLEPAGGRAVVLIMPDRSETVLLRGHTRGLFEQGGDHVVVPTYGGVPGFIRVPKAGGPSKTFTLPSQARGAPHVFLGR